MQMMKDESIRWRGGCLVIQLLLGLTIAARLTGAGPNLATDAVTRATTYHTHTGDVSVLVDGIVPPAAGAVAFEWPTQGVLAFDWGEAATIAAIRLRVGHVANDYAVRTFVGGHLLDEGTTRDPEGQLTASVLDLSRGIDTWVQIDLPADTRADNLELHSLGPVQLYEVEILPISASPVTPPGWARVKMHRPVP